MVLIIKTIRYFAEMVFVSSRLFTVIHAHSLRTLSIFNLSLRTSINVGYHLRTLLRVLGEFMSSLHFSKK